MEPNNFEKDFREKLNNRTIAPSEKAWDRLDAMLSVAENKKPKKDFKWLYIAASIAGFLLVGTLFFNQKEATGNPTNTVVIQENVIKDSVKNQNPVTLDSGQKQIAVAEKETSKNTTNSDKKTGKTINQKLNQTIRNENNQIAESSIIIKKNQEKQSIKNQTLIIETSKNESISQLTEKAEKAIVADNSAKPKSKVKINADDLLNQVDGELELSFREKVISKVNKNYQTVKVALANRNNQ